MLVTVEVGDRYMGPHTQDRHMGALFILSLSAFENFPNEKSESVFHHENVDVHILYYFYLWNSLNYGRR